MRRNDKKVTAEDLHELLVLSRYLGLCQGRTALDGDMWQRAKQLEQERKSRLQRLPPHPVAPIPQYESPVVER